MCGIAGFLGSFSQSLLSDMIGTIAHRGPDDNGICLIKEHGLGLAHRRLSIIDLSPAGHQPMWDVHKRAVIVFYAEIYIYRELQFRVDPCWFSVSVTRDYRSRSGGVRPVNTGLDCVKIQAFAFIT